MKNTIRTTATMMLLIATLGSCQKGDTGAAGTNGTNGTNGNANVVSGSISVSPSDWAWDATNHWYVDALTDSAITTDIVNSGSVLAFVQIQPDVNWYAMPYAFANTPTLSIYYAYNYFLYTVHLTFQFSNQAQATSIATYNFKVVCITSTQRKAHPNTDWNDYNSIKATLGNSLIETTIKK